MHAQAAVTTADSLVSAREAIDDVVHTRPMYLQVFWYGAPIVPKIAALP